MTKIEDRKTEANCGCANGAACRCSPCTCKNCNCWLDAPSAIGRGRRLPGDHVVSVSTEHLAHSSHPHHGHAGSALRTSAHATLHCL